MTFNQSIKGVLNPTKAYFMFRCELNSIDCEASWKLKQTSLGYCLAMDTNQVYHEKVKTLQKMKHAGGDGKFHFPRKKRFSLFGDNIRENIQDALKKLETIPKAHEINSLNVVIGYNKSDNTFGWNGFDNALHMHFLDKDDKFLGTQRRLSLQPSLNPSITFTQKMVKKLGTPFTECNSDPSYTERNCQIYEYMAKVLDKCDCYPR